MDTLPGVASRPFHGVDRRAPWPGQGAYGSLTAARPRTEGTEPGDCRSLGRSRQPSGPCFTTYEAPWACRCRRRDCATDRLDPARRRQFPGRHLRRPGRRQRKGRRTKSLRYSPPTHQPRTVPPPQNADPLAAPPPPSVKAPDVGRPRQDTAPLKARPPLSAAERAAAGVRPVATIAPFPTRRDADQDGDEDLIDQIEADQADDD